MSIVRSRGVALAAALMAVAPRGQAQFASDPARAVWRGAAEANGSVLYGAASQRVLATSLGVQHESARLQWRVELQGAYGDARDQERGSRSVIVRTARLSSSADLHPRATISPFAFGTLESSLQQRIASRVSVGAGAKWTIWRPDSVVGGFVEDGSVSLAVLGEDTRAIAREAMDNDRGAGARLRWSLRARYRRRLGTSLRLSHLTFYQPTIDRPGRYTLEATTSLAMPIRARVDFTVSHRERLDSEARDRGAPSIRDGQLLFGVRATF